MTNVTLTKEQAQQIEEALEDIVRVFKFETGTPVEALAAIREARAAQATVSGGLCGGCAKKAADGWALYCVECWEQAEKEPVAFHRASFLSGYEAAQSDANACDVPPQGWICTRQAGHDGPCAAIEDNNGHELVSRAMSRLAEQDAAPQPVKQEPMAWWFQPPNKNVRPMFDTQQHGGKWKPLYASPVQQIDLTPYEITALIRDGAAGGGWQGFAQRVIAKFKEKNK